VCRLWQFFCLAASPESGIPWLGRKGQAARVCFHLADTSGKNTGCYRAPVIVEDAPSCGSNNCSNCNNVVVVDSRVLRLPQLDYKCTRQLVWHVSCCTCSRAGEHLSIWASESVYLWERVSGGACMCGCHCTCHPCSLPAKIASAVGKKLLFIIGGPRFPRQVKLGIIWVCTFIQMRWDSTNYCTSFAYSSASSAAVSRPICPSAHRPTCSARPAASQI